MEYSGIRSFGTRKDNGGYIAILRYVLGSVIEVDIRIVDADLRRMENSLEFHRKSGEVLENAGEFSANYEMARCVVNQACCQWGYERIL
ncbi:MAG: hypothetical protein HY831_03380 [Candidatus Aenigmarchaeota archaeon]|nr:hypothetical protein [Candidatus Aenigmarchaeota archaeon]